MEVYVDRMRVGSNHSVNTRGDSGRGTFAWKVVSIADNRALRDTAATAKPQAVHFDGVVLATTPPGCPGRGPSRP